MNYFRASEAEQLFCRFKELALQYWGAQPPDSPRWNGAKRAESEQSFALRQQINMLFPEVNNLAHELGIGITWQSYPMPAVGGPVIPVNMLLSVIDQDMGHGHIEKAQILDVIDRAIGTAELVKKRAFRRMVNPVFWPIDLAAFIVRIPFLILRKAGLPASVEENVISNIIKGLMTLAILLLTAYLGLEKHIGDILRAFGK